MKRPLHDRHREACQPSGGVWGGGEAGAQRRPWRWLRAWFPLGWQFLAGLASVAVVGESQAGSAGLQIGDGAAAVVGESLLGAHLVALTVLGLAGVGGLIRGTRSSSRIGWGPMSGVPDEGERRASAERERDALAQRLRMLIGSMPTGCVVQDRDFRVVEWNAAAEHIFGFAAADVVGRSPYDSLFPPEAGALAGEIRDRLRAGDPFAHGVTENVTRDGRRILCEWQDTRMTDSDGTVVGYLSVVTDISERCRQENDRQEREARHRLLFESMNDGYALQELVFDGQGNPVDCRFLDVNPAFERLCGRGLASVVGHTAREVFGNLDPACLDAFARAALHGESAHREAYFPRLDRWFEIAAFPTGGPQFGAILADITARVRDREALLDRERELEAIFNETPVIRILVSRDGVVRRINRAGRDRFGVTEGTLLPARVGEVIRCQWSALDTAECPLVTTCSLCGHSGEEESEPGGGGRPEARREVQLPLLGPDGTTVETTFLVSTSPLRLSGRAMTLVCLEDVSESREAAERIREQAALLAAAHEAIYVLDLDGRIRFWNEGAERLYGWGPADAVGRPAAEVVFGGSGPMWENLRRLALDEGFWDGELLQVHRDTRQLIVDVRASLVRDSQGEHKSLLVVANDLTERRRLERQLMRAQRLESLGTLACGVAHDLNNVLTPVQMVADLLRSSSPSLDAQRLLDLLTRSARRGADIIKQLLLFGRGIDSARTELDLRYLAKEVAKMLRETFPKAIQVEFDLPEELWTVAGDVTQLHQVLLNLCVNARDAMPKGGTLTLAAANIEIDETAARSLPGAQPGRYVAVEVADTGVGIPVEALDRIFDPFFTTKPLGQGTGLGLATVQGIVRGHQGFIQVVSEVGQGSRFRIHLPVSEVQPATAPPATSPKTSRQGDNRWVLVVDDEESIREVVSEALQRAQYRVVVARDGAEAISIFGRRYAEIDVVVADMMMPFIDGAAAITMFRKIKPSVAVVAVSGLPGQREEAERAAGGRLVFLGKPFVPDDLVSALAQAIESDSKPAVPAFGTDRGEDCSSPPTPPGARAGREASSSPILSERTARALLPFLR